MTDPSMADVGVQQLAPLLLVASMDASLRFWVDQLGFRMTNSWTPEGRIRWCWLEHGGAALMLQERGPADPRRNDPPGTVGVGVSFNFMCRDALALYRIVKGRGVAVRRPFVGNGLWVVSLVDPDGYQVNFESPTDAAEETEYDG